MLLCCARRGGGCVLWPVLAGTARLVIAALFGWLGVAWLGFGEPALVALVPVAAAAFGAVNAAGMLRGAWGRGSSKHPLSWDRDPTSGRVAAHAGSVCNE